MKPLHRKLFLLVIQLFWIAIAHTTPLLLKGTIGHSIIYLELDGTSTSLSGHYYYQNQLIDIPLSGKISQNEYRLKTNYETYAPSISEIEYFTFSKNETGYSGKWKQGNKLLELKLNAIPAVEWNPKKLSANPDLNALSLSGISKIKLNYFKLTGVDSVIFQNGIRLRLFKEVTTGIEFFRVDSGLTDAKLAFVNLQLEYQHIHFFYDFLDCASDNGSIGDFNIYYELKLVSEHLFSILFFNSFMCGSMPHPDEENYGLNIDLDQGIVLKNADFLTNFAYQKKEGVSNFQDRIYHYLKAENPELFNDQLAVENNDLVGMECGYYELDLWEPTVSMCFTDEGLQILPFFGHVYAPCLAPEWAIIPYSKLTGIVKETYLQPFLKSKF
jgi:hypothetical protein